MHDGSNPDDVTVVLRTSGDLDLLAAQRSTIDTGAGSIDAAQDPVTGFFDERKGRYCGYYSSVAFPHFVRSAVGSRAALRLHSYGWNVNVRQESQPPGWNSIRRVITYQEIEKYTIIFFEIVHPAYPLFDESVCKERIKSYWCARVEPSADFEAVVAGIVALGSLFADDVSMAEAQLVEHAKTLLDIGSCYGPGRLSIDQGAAWVLRTEYLRSTTRPHTAWFASCAAMHVAEGLALHMHQATGHHDPRNAGLRVLHCALLLNGIISAEYGRSRVRLDLPRGNLPDTYPPSAHLSLATTLFAINDAQPGAGREDALQLLAQIPTTHPIMEMSRTDIALLWYRRNFLGSQTKLSGTGHNLLLRLIRNGISQVLGLLELRHPWWNLISTPFQSLLVLLSIDSDDSLALVPQVHDCLKAVPATFDASLATEAVETAQQLLSALKEKKKAHLAHLDSGSDCLLGMRTELGDVAQLSNGAFMGSTMDSWLNLFDAGEGESFAWDAGIAST